MKRLLVVLPAALILLLLGLVLWWGFRREEPAPRLDVAFVRPGVIEVRNTRRAETIEVYDAAARLVARAKAFGRPVTEVRFAWQPGAAYRVVPESGLSVTASAPETVPRFIVRLHAPLGQTPHQYAFAEPYPENPRQEIAVPAAPGETVDVMLEIEKLTDGPPIPFCVSSEMDEAASGGLRMEPAIDDERASLELEFDKRFWTSRVRLGDRLPEEPVLVTLQTGEFCLSLGLHFVDRQLGRQGVSIVRWELPTERDGFSERQRVADRVTMPNLLWVRAASWFNVRSGAPSAFEPFVYQALWIRNETAQPVSLLVTSEILDSSTREPLGYFASPQLDSTGGTGRIMDSLHLGPGETRPCVLPVYVRPKTPAGTYLRRIEIRPLGSDTPLRVLERPLGVVRSNLVFSGWVLGVAVLSLTWLVVTLVLYRRIVRSLGVRVLVLLSLLGSLQFGLQFAGGLVSMALYAVLGPFNCLVGGLLTEVMTYLLITSILFLVPRPGAMTLAGLVSYVMGGILFGSFGLTDLLFVGSAIAFRELFLFGFGVTRFGAAGQAPPRLWAMMLALGLADAASAFTSLALQAVFYRLFFAHWYIFLQVVVTGFLYTALGVYLGKSLGMSLRKVHL